MNEENNNLGNSVTPTPVTPTDNSVDQNLGGLTSSSLPQQVPVESTNMEQQVPIQNNVSNLGQDVLVNNQPSSLGQEISSPTVNETASSVDITNFNAANNNGMQSVQDFSGSDQVIPTPQNGGIISPSNTINEPIDSSNVGFVQNGQPLNKKKNPIIVTMIFIVILAVIGAILYFFVYPFIIFKFFSNPKNVYDRTIDVVAKQLSAETDTLVKDKGILEANLSFDTDIKSLYDFKGYTFTGRFGCDPKEELLEYGYNIKDSKNNDVGQSFYIKNNSLYTRYSTYRDLIYSGNSNDEDFFESVREMLDEAKKINKEDYLYVIEAWKREIKNSIDESKLSKENASITVNGESLKVLKHKYVLNKDDIIGTRDFIYKNLAKDEKYVGIIAKQKGISTELAEKDILGEAYSYKDSDGFEVKVDKADDLDLDDDYVMTINIYTYGNKLDFVGMSIDTSVDEQHMHYYNKNGNFELILKDKYENFSAVGTKNHDKTDVVVKFDDKKIADLVLNKFSEKEIDIDYSIVLDENSKENTYTGKFTYKSNPTNDKNNYNVSLKLNMPDKTYIGLTLDIIYDWTSDVANVNTSAAAQLTDAEMYNVENTFNSELMKTPLGIFYSTMSGLTSSSVTDYYSSTDFDSYDDYDFFSNSSLGL